MFRKFPELDNYFQEILTFLKKRTTFCLPSVGIWVGSLRAHDADQSDFYNRIIFSITDGSFGSFILFSETISEGYRGNITVDPAVELDYESERQSYDLSVEASDLGGEKVKTTVKVIVVDVNDTPPEFPSDMVLDVKENSTLSMPLDTIKGKDVDTKHRLEYELDSTECQCSGIKGPCPEEWFKVERNGEVITNTDYNIDYEKCDKVFLNAKVVDVLTEKRSNSTKGTFLLHTVHCCFLKNICIKKWDGPFQLQFYISGHIESNTIIYVTRIRYK